MPASNIEVATELFPFTWNALEARQFQKEECSSLENYTSQ
jgi:hypothetical protein